MPGVLEQLKGFPSASVYFEPPTFPVADEKGGDLYLQGYSIEVLFPNLPTPEFELIPRDFIDPTLTEDNIPPGQVNERHVVLYPKRGVRIDVERLEKFRGLVRKDGVWTFAARWISHSGVWSDQDTWQTILLDLSKPKVTGLKPKVFAMPSALATMHS